MTKSSNDSHVNNYYFQYLFRIKTVFYIQTDNPNISTQEDNYLIKLNFV